MKTKHYLWILPFLLILATGCVDLKGVHSYSGNSAEAMEKFDEIGFSFKSICRNDHYLNHLGEILSKPVYERIQRDEAVLNCSRYVKADAAFHKMYFVTLKYLEGLEKLSSDDILTFEYDTLTKALKESELLKVDEEEIQAFSKLADLVTRLVVDTKRRKDLQEIIENGNAPFQKLMESMIYGIDSSMIKTLTAEIKLYHNNYEAMVARSDLNVVEKISAENDYIKKRSELLDKIRLMEEYSKILSEIKKGHQALYDNRDKIRKKEIAEFLAPYIKEIRELKTEFDNLKTEN